MTVLHLSVGSDLHLPSAVLLVMTRNCFKSILKNEQYFGGISNCNYDDEIPNSFVFVQAVVIYFLVEFCKWNNLHYLHNQDILIFRAGHTYYQQLAVPHVVGSHHFYSLCLHSVLVSIGL